MTWRWPASWRPQEFPDGSIRTFLAGHDATIEIGGKERNLRDYVWENWTTIKEQFRVARQVADAIEAVTGVDIEGERALAA